MMRTLLAVLVLALAGPAAAHAAIRVDPTGVNVNTQGATTVFLTFGGLADQRPAEALWCGELIPATPDIGFKCDPATIFGSLPLRFDRSSVRGGRFTDIMSIPPSVTRRAYQAAEAGAPSAFFYVRRFVSTTGGPDEYVAVTCRLAGGGARVPLALLDVRLSFATKEPILFVPPGSVPPPVAAEITYSGTGRLVGRWEVVMPGEELPTPQDLLPEASLPPDQRGLQRRYTPIGRFNVFLPPVGRITLPGPDPSRLPTTLDGTYYLLLRVEASDDKEGDSNLANAGAGQGIVHSGAVAGFPLPPLRYVVQGADGPTAAWRDLALLTPADGAVLDGSRVIDFAWTGSRDAAVYRLEIADTAGNPVLSALVPVEVSGYRAPSWLRDRASQDALRWRVIALDIDGRPLRFTGWRSLTVTTPDAEP